MMALKEGSQYGLLSRDFITGSNISCIQVKLTDAALKVIEDNTAGNVRFILFTLLEYTFRTHRHDRPVVVA